MNAIQEAYRDIGAAVYDKSLTDKEIYAKLDIIHNALRMAVHGSAVLQLNREMCPRCHGTNTTFWFGPLKEDTGWKCNDCELPYEPCSIIHEDPIPYAEALRVLREKEVD